MPIAYTVTAALPDEHLVQEYLAWLTGGHLKAVLTGGATSAEVVRLDGPGRPIRVESRYRFPDRGAFDAYERDAAPALRAEGRSRFDGRDVTFERRLGDIVATQARLDSVQ